MRPVSAFIGLGSNLGEREQTIRDAVRSLAELPETELGPCSSLYETAPVGHIEQPDFLNAVCQINTRQNAEELLRILLAMESAAGRQRTGEHGGPRTLDLDLLIYGSGHIDKHGLQIPHPRMHERAFVLYPLSEIAPQLVIPGHGAVKELCAQCSDQTIRKLPQKTHQTPC